MILKNMHMYTHMAYIYIQRGKQIILITVVFNNTQNSRNLGKAARRDKGMN